MTSPASLLTAGFVLGWSVAWPPGPINAEMIRRALAHGFWRAFGVGLGACSGDALWAVAVALGAGLLIGSAAHLALAVTSTALLFLLAGLFLYGAGHEWLNRTAAAARTVEPPPSRRGSYLLGLTMALTSPWNIAFWLAVIGRVQLQRQGLGSALVVAAAVIGGAASWCLVLCLAAARLRVRFGGPLWQIVAKGATGVLMLGFALHGIFALAAG